jgi:hypothetical protein
VVSLAVLTDRWPAIPRDVACGLVALAIGLAAVWLSVVGYGGRLSTLVRMVRTDPIARVVAADPDFVYVGSHNDGIYFLAIAVDPLATGQPHQLIDFAAYRYGHPAYGWAAGVLSLFGARLVPLALVLISLGSLFAAGLFASRVSEMLGWSAWGGLVIGFNPGLLFAVVNDTSEAFGAALLAATLWAWLSERRAVLTLLLIPLCFAKEPLLLVPVGLALWEAVASIRRGSHAVSARRLAALVPGPALYIFWVAYVHGRLGIWPFAEGNTLDLPVPLAGWIGSMRTAADMATQGFPQMQVGESSLPIQLVSLAAVALGMIRAVRLRSPIDAIYLPIAILMCFLSWYQVLYPKDLIRTLAFTFILLPAVLPNARWPARESPRDVPRAEGEGVSDDGP